MKNDTGVSLNGGFSPNHPILIGFSIIFTSHIGGVPPIFGKHPYINPMGWGKHTFGLGVPRCQTGPNPYLESLDTQPTMTAGGQELFNAKMASNTTVTRGGMLSFVFLFNTGDFS